MANTLTNTDVYTIINSVSKQMFGETALQAVDTTTFATVGEHMLRTGYENTLNALSEVLGRTMFAIRPYKARFGGLITANDMEWGAIVRKISYFTGYYEESDDWNTDVKQNLKDGQTVDHYKIKKRYPLEINFAGNKVLQNHVTRFRKQLKLAFKSESEFSAFYSALATEIANEIEHKKEAETRALLLNHIGAVYSVGNDNMKVNLVKAFNDEFGTTYTTAQLLSEHYTEFLEFFTAKIKKLSDMLEEDTTLYHLTPSVKDDVGNDLTLLRHTPKSAQRIVLNKNFIYDAESRVLPAIFNDRYLKIDDYEGVMYWQSPATPYSVNVTPNVLDIATGASKDGASVSLDHVIGILFDKDALSVNYKMEDIITTPVNAGGDYYNTYYHWAKNYNDDLTENSILFYMADEG